MTTTTTTATEATPLYAAHYIALTGLVQARDSQPPFERQPVAVATVASITRQYGNLLETCLFDLVDAGYATHHSGRPGEGCFFLPSSAGRKAARNRKNFL